MSEASVAEPLVICDYRIKDNPTGMYGCFRCIDDELLARLLSMVAENKVKVFSAPIIPIDMQVSEKTKKEYLDSYEGDEATNPDSNKFFTFLHDNNICFKIFFTPAAFIEEHNNVEILKTIPSVEAVVGDQADVDEQAVVEVEEQSNFLQKFTTYYEYEYETIDGSRQSSCAFMLEFTNSVKIVTKDKEIVTSQIYIILNKFCNNIITDEDVTSDIFSREIHHALRILNSHEYLHGDLHLNNVVDCGEYSNPRYKLIDFGKMGKKNPREEDYGKKSFDTEIAGLKHKLNSRNAHNAYINFMGLAPEPHSAATASETAHNLTQQQNDPKEKAANKASLQTKFKIIHDFYPELRKMYRFMMTNYISEYLHSLCPKAVVVSSSYKSKEEGLNYRERLAYPSATFKFESVKDFDECTKKLKNLELLEGSLTATYSSGGIERLYQDATNYEPNFRKKILDIESYIIDTGIFLSKHTIEQTRFGDDFETKLDKYYNIITRTLNIQDQGGGKTRYKLKRSTRRKTGTRTITRTKSKNKRKTITRRNSKSKLKNKRRTRTKSKSKSKSKSKNKHRTRRK
jgi:hypothetical protein